MFVLVIRTIASVGSWMVGSGTESTLHASLRLPGDCFHVRSFRFSLIDFSG